MPLKWFVGMPNTWGLTQDVQYELNFGTTPFGVLETTAPVKYEYNKFIAFQMNLHRKGMMVILIKTYNIKHTILILSVELKVKFF